MNARQPEERLPNRFHLPPLVVGMFREPAQIFIHRPEEVHVPVVPGAPVAAAPGCGFASNHLLTYFLRILTVLMVWCSAAVNIYYYLTFRPIFLLVILYLLLCQFYAILSNMDRIHSADPLELRTKQLIRQIFLFTLCERLFGNLTLGAFIFKLKELVLIAIVVLTTSYFNSGIWTKAAIANLSINCIAFVGNLLAEKYIVDDMLESSWNWLQARPCFRNVFVYSSYVCCWACFGFSMFVLWKITPAAFGMELFAWVIFALSTLCWSLNLDVANRVKNVVSLPTVVSALLSTNCCACWICLVFFARYIQLPGLFAAMLYYRLNTTESIIEANIEQLTAAFLLSIFSPLEIAIGNLI